MVEIDGRTIVLGTPDAGTIRVALPTLPPVDASFEPLLAENADIVGWLKVSDIIDLPGAQRDNEYYLTHNFFGEETAEGAAFMDGEELSSGALFMDEANKLFPLDGNTLIYGHNMHDGSMFGRLSRYANARYLRENPIVEFATLYETGEYVPFAAFHASMEAEDEEYFEIRQLAFDMEDSFDLFIEQLRARSVYYVPIDVRYGDALLSLVTCSYEQDNVLTNGKEPLEWIVLKTEGDRAMLITRYLIDARAYHKAFVKMTWSECTLRQWLNDTFLKETFSQEEQARIQEVLVVNDDNPHYSTRGGEDTMDRVFLLSEAEVLEFFPQQEQRTCQATEYAKAQGAYVDENNGNSWWWLRSPGVRPVDACGVRADGRISGYGSRDVNRPSGTIRPVIWVTMGE